jgi:hypothetical protein
MVRVSLKCKLPLFSFFFLSQTYADKKENDEKLWIFCQCQCEGKCQLRLVDTKDDKKLKWPCIRVMRFASFCGCFPGI